MSKGYPSMTALLGLLAVAGFQNRDKISEWLGGHGTERKSFRNLKSYKRRKRWL